MTSAKTGTVGAVVIGRNEGDRLVRCLASMQGDFTHIIYIDSGSTDDSITLASDAGARVVLLDDHVPFTAARARNAGVDALREIGPLPDYIQFIDGDCELVPGWIDTARTALDAEPDLGLVTGWRAELHRDRSVFNAMSDFEWHQPAGEILSCGGDMMVRATAFENIGGFNPQVIASEDEELCIRIRKSGLRIKRLASAMTLHDADMTRFSQWWRRTVRSGHGFAQVGRMHPDHFVKERKRVWVFAGILPALAIIGVLFSLWLLVLIVAVIYALSYLRTVSGLVRKGLPKFEAAHHAAYLTLSKFPNILGMLTYYWRKSQGSEMRIIEYK